MLWTKDKEEFFRGLDVVLEAIVDLYEKMRGASEKKIVYLVDLEKEPVIQRELDPWTGEWGWGPPDCNEYSVRLDSSFVDLRTWSITIDPSIFRPILYRRLVAEHSLTVYSDLIDYIPVFQLGFMLQNEYSYHTRCGDNGVLTMADGSMSKFMRQTLEFEEVSTTRGGMSYTGKQTGDDDLCHGSVR